MEQPKYQWQTNGDHVTLHDALDSYAIYCERRLATCKTEAYKSFWTEALKRTQELITNITKVEVWD